MNIQPADRLSLFGGKLHLQNDRLTQNVAVHIDLACCRRHRHPRQCWIRNWILERQLIGHYEVLIDQPLNADVYGHRNFVRLSPELFRELVERGGPVIQKEKTRFREPLLAGLKVVITLRYLAEWDSYKTLMYGFRVVFSIISLFVPDMCKANYQLYREEQLKCPSTPARMV